MTIYQIIKSENSWELVGPKTRLKFKIKNNAIKAGRKIAKSQNIPLIIQSSKGDVISVNLYNRKIGTSRIMPPKVKHKLDERKVRNSIAEVLLERRAFN